MLKDTQAVVGMRGTGGSGTRIFLEKSVCYVVDKRRACVRDSSEMGYQKKE